MLSASSVRLASSLVQVPVEVVPQVVLDVDLVLRRGHHHVVVLDYPLVADPSPCGRGGPAEPRSGPPPCPPRVFADGLLVGDLCGIRGCPWRRPRTAGSRSPGRGCCGRCCQRGMPRRPRPRRPRPGVEHVGVQVQPRQRAHQVVLLCAREPVPLRLRVGDPHVLQVLREPRFRRPVPPFEFTHFPVQKVEPRRRS